MMIKKRFCVLLLLSAAFFFWPLSCGICSGTITLTQAEAETLENHLNELQQNNEMLLTLLGESGTDLTKAAEALKESKNQIQTLKAQLQTLTDESARLSSSLRTANAELQKASEYYKQREKERDRIEGRLRNQRTVWQVLACILAGVAAAR